MKKFLALAAAVVCSAATLSAQADADKYVHKANYDLASRFSAKKVGQMVYSTRVTPNWFAESDRFWYSYKTAAGTKYYVVDPVKGTKSELFDMERLAMQLTEIVKDPYDAQHIPLTGLKLKDDKTFEFSITSTRDKVEKPDTTKAQKGAGQRAGGPAAPAASRGGSKKMVHYFEYDIATKTLKDVTADHKEKKSDIPRWASVSPDGTIAMYSKNHNLYWMDSTNFHKAAKDEKDSTIVEHRITSDGVKDFAYGSSYGDEKDTTRRGSAYGYWSPDSKHFAVIREDERNIKDLWVINALSNPRPTLETYKYQMPGEPGATSYLYIVDAQKGTIREIKSHTFKDQTISIERPKTKAADQYKENRPRVWEGDEKGFWLVKSSRDLYRIDLCYVGVDADSTHAVVSERLNTYNETRDRVPINGGKQFIWWSERNGWANIYLYNADGTLVRNLTDGAYHVEDVLGVNEAAGYVVFSACGVNKDENPYQMHNFKVSLNGGPIQQLDMDDMDVLATSSDDGKFIVANCSRVDYKPFTVLYNTQTGKKVDLEEADFSRLLAAGYKFPERFKVKASDGITDLYGAMYKPFDFDSTKVYPVADYVYPGPQVEANNISWSSGMTRTDRLAQLGFIVITVGNRGGHPNRSKWYHNYGYGNLRDYGLEDQKYAVEQLCAKYKFMDINRVGIHGHSGGGFMSTAAILTYPDFFKVAVSCAGNHDNSIYNRWWSETHHGVKETIEKGDTTFVYHIETNPQLASNLKGHLMLVHGDVDNNVHPGNTTRVINALIKANKRFDMLFLPGQRHSFGDMNEYFFWRMADYYSEWLLGDTQRPIVDIYQLNNEK